MSSAKKRKKKYPAREISTVHISCLIHDSFVTRRLLYDFCESEYKKKFCVIVLCFYKLAEKQKKTAKTTTTNVVLKEGDCGGSGGLLKNRLFVDIFEFFLATLLQSQAQPLETLIILLCYYYLLCCDTYLYIIPVLYINGRLKTRRGAKEITDATRINFLSCYCDI